MQKASCPKYSLVIPVYNEEETLPTLFDELKKLMSQMDGESEVIFIDDGSRDQSYRIMKEQNQKDSRFRVLRFSRNFGHQLAITAGIDHTSGDAVVIMDADLQDSPTVVLDMIAKWKEGYEVVYGVRIKRHGETFFKKITAKGYYWLMQKLSNIEIPMEAGDFRLVDRKVVEVFRRLRENHRYVRGIFSWIGFKQTGVPFVRAERYAGETKYPLIKMMRFALDGMLSFSNVPLKLALNLGFLISFFSFIYGTFLITGKILGLTETVQGWVSLIVVIFFLGGVQLIMIGILGEYIARIHTEIKGRPLYVVREYLGVAPLEMNQASALKS